MHAWMTLWTSLLIIGAVSFLGLIVVVGGGAIKELRMMLDDLRHESPEELTSTEGHKP